MRYIPIKVFKADDKVIPFWELDCYQNQEEVISKNHYVEISQATLEKCCMGYC